MESGCAASSARLQDNPLQRLFQALPGKGGGRLFSRAVTVRSHLLIKNYKILQYVADIGSIKKISRKIFK
jgi:hypothetical protein